MSREFRRILVRDLCLAVVFGLLVAAAPGCDDGAAKKQEAAGEIPANVKASNKNMQDYMNSQKKK
jgi:hypothetical protein